MRPGRNLTNSKMAEGRMNEFTTRPNENGGPGSIRPGGVQDFPSVENHRKGKCLPNRPLPFSTDSGIPNKP